MKNLTGFLSSVLGVFICLNSMAQTNTNSLQFNGVSDYVNLASNSLYNMDTNSFTYQFYFKINNVSNLTTTHYQMLWAKGASMEINHNGYFMDARNNSGNNIAHVVIGSNNIKVHANSSTIIQDSIWYNMAVVVDRQTNELKLYINGILEQSLSITNIGSLDNDWPVQIGRYKWEGSGNIDHYLNGNIDEIATWNYALTTQEIQQYMLCPPDANESGLIGFWNMEEGTGETITDQSVNNNTGYLNGGTWSTDVAPYYCCTSNLITTEPDDETVMVGDDAHFGVSTSNANVSYQWQGDSGFGFTNLTNAGQFSGVNTDYLTVSSITSSQNNWLFRCLISENPYCIDTSKQAKLFVNTTSTGNINSGTLVQISPNPSSDYITINFDKTFNGRILISDMIGSVLMNRIYRSNNINIDLKQLNVNGVYIITIIDFYTNTISYHNIIYQK